MEFDSAALQQATDIVQRHWPVATSFLIGALAAVGLCITFLIRPTRRQNALDAEQRMLQQQLADERLEIRGRERVRLETQLEGVERELSGARLALESRTRELSDRQSSQVAMEVRLEEGAKAFAEKEALFKESSNTLKREFELLANRVFEHQGQKHEEKLSGILSPFRDQIVDFRKRVEQVYHTDTKDRASLLNEVKNLQKASEKINQEAENLTKALKGDVKLQGNWGEMVLERVLEESGLRSGHEFFLQAARRSETGELKRPDVLIRLPDDKYVIIDAKVSLLAYEQALSAETDALREAAAKKHVASLKSHVKRLADQDYDQLSDVRSLDFVLLFVPIESAFTLALEQDHRLFTQAFEKRIVIVSPTTLMMTLRIIHNVWRFEKQNRNAQEIASKAGALYDKLRGLIEDMDQMGRQLEGVNRTYESAFGKIARGKGNLVRQVEQFRELGAKVKKPLPRPVVEEAEQDPG